MSLLQKASIITTPTAYAEDYLYSIKPALKVSDTELVNNGDFSDGLTGWSGSNPPTLNADNSVTYDDAGENIFRSWSKIIGRRYRLTFDGTGSIRYRTGFAGSDGTIVSKNLPCEVDLVATSNTNRIQIYGASGGVIGILKSVSIKEVTDADFDFDRNSTGTRVNEDYLIEDVPYNLASYSEDYSQSFWAKTRVTITTNVIIAPDGTLTADKLEATTTQEAYVQGDVIVQGSKQTLSFYVKQGNTNYCHLLLWDKTANGARQWFNINNGTVGSTTSFGSGVTVASASIESAGNGWFRCKAVFNNTDATIGVRINVSDNDADGNPSVGDFIYIWGGQIVKGDKPKDYLKTTDRLDIPRIDYTNGEPSILLEPQRTNLIANNSTAGIVGSATITNNYAISPEGIQNSIRVVTTGTGNNSGVIYSVANTSTTDTFTYSIYVKGEKGKTVHIRIETTPYSLQSQELFLLDGTWQKFTKTIDYTGAPTHSFKQFYLTSISSATATDFQVYGAQMEEGSYATSLIHTSGSAVTRSQDVGSNAGNSDLISSVEGVLYVDANFKNITGGTYISISNAAGNRILIGTENGTGRVYGSSLVTAFSIDYDRYNKIAYCYKANERKIFLNGKSIYSSTASYTVPTGMNELSFDSTGAGSQKTQGNVKMVAVFKEALTDLELEKLTGYNNHELYMNYYNRLSYLGLVEEYNVESDINNYIL